VSSSSKGSLVVVGSVALDTIDWPARGECPDVLGGAATFFSVASSYFAKPRLVGVVGDDLPKEHLDFLAGRGVDLAGLERIAGGKTFRWKGRYFGEDLCSRESLDTQLGVFGDFQPKLPDAWRDADLLFLANIAPELQLDVRQQMRRPLLVAADTMNFWIQGRPEALERTLAHVDLLIINDEESRLLARTSNLVRAAHVIQELGPKTVIIKRGDAGALLFSGKEIFAAPAFPLADVLDPTGAGDSFAGGLMGHLARHLAAGGEINPDALRRGVIYGNVIASFAVEGYGLDRLRALTDEEIEGRYRAFRALTRFDGA
jgi:sugar/nucleoside kinase (ribokinase family)